MAIVQMKCPNCGGIMELSNNQFICPNCRTMMLNIVDAKIDADVTVISPDEFAKKIEDSKRQFIVNINDNLKVFDIDTMVINKKIQDATECLNNRKFSEVISCLNGVSSNILSVERLRYLAEFRVENEYELSFHSGYIDSNQHFQNIICLAEEQTKATYQKIADYCREQYDTKCRIEYEIKEVNKLLDVKLYQEAIAYINEMCKRYPQTALSWIYACKVKCTISKNYNCNLEFSMMEKCPDYFVYDIPEVLKAKINEFAELSKNYEVENKKYTNTLGNLTLCIWIAAIVLILFFITTKGEFIKKSLNNPFFYLGCNLVWPITIVASIILIVKTIKIRVSVNNLKEKYNIEKNLVPDEIKSKYAINRKSIKSKFYYGAFIIGISLIISFIIYAIVILNMDK